MDNELFYNIGWRNKITVCAYFTGKDYRHMVRPFVNSALAQNYNVHIFTDVELYGLPLNATYHIFNPDHVEFFNKIADPSKEEQLSNKPAIWNYIRKVIGPCILMDIDTIILDDISDITRLADIVFTLEERWSDQGMDYINTGVMWAGSEKVMRDWAELTSKLTPKDIVASRKQPYLAPDQYAFHKLIDFKKDTVEYRYSDLNPMQILVDVLGVPCDVYNFNNPDKPIPPFCKVLHYKGSYCRTGGKQLPDDRKKIIEKYNNQ